MFLTLVRNLLSLHRVAKHVPEMRQAHEWIVAAKAEELAANSRRTVVKKGQRATPRSSAPASRTACRASRASAHWPRRDCDHGCGWKTHDATDSAAMAGCAGHTRAPIRIVSGSSSYKSARASEGGSRSSRPAASPASALGCVLLEQWRWSRTQWPPTPVLPFHCPAGRPVHADRQFRTRTCRGRAADPRSGHSRAPSRLASNQGASSRMAGSAATDFRAGMVPVATFQVSALSGSAVANLTNSHAISWCWLLGETTLPQPASAAKRCSSPA